MARSIVLTFALLYGAVIALICAVYVYLMNRRKKKAQKTEEATQLVDTTEQ